MNIIKLYGGLGNQMFQYAFGKAMEQYGTKVGFDLSWFEKPSPEVPRPYGLDKFQTEVLVRPILLPTKSVRETEHDYYRYRPEYLKMENSAFFGYWQNRQYVEMPLFQLKDEFKIRSEYRTNEFDMLKAKILSSPDSIAIHVRRGDYLTKGHHLLPLEYYYEAMKVIKNKGQVFIFSDDIPWCKLNFPETCVFVDMVDYLSLDLIRSCTHKITANSTFSWWAGILGEGKGYTFAPKRWRLDDKEEAAVEAEKFIPTNWIRI